MFVVIFIAVFFSSIIGATICGISLNKLALVPLEVYLILKNGNRTRFMMNKTQEKLVLWYLIAGVASISGIVFSLVYNRKLFDELINVAIMQIASYLLILVPIALLIWNSTNLSKYMECFKKAILWTCRIQALWGIAQFILIHTIGFDLNGSVLGTLFGGEWSQYSNFANSSGGVILRVTGINYGAAFLGFFLLIGFILDTKVFLKFIYVVCSLMALSRSAILGIAFVVIYKLMQGIGRISQKKVISGLKYVAIVFVFIGIFIKFYCSSPALQVQIARVVERFSAISTGEDGTNRHIGYPLAVFYLEIFKIPILQKIVGVGNQCGGILVSYYSDSVSWLGLSTKMKDLEYIWTLESDLASIFLETGILGGIVYYWFIFSSYKKAAPKDQTKRALIFGLAIFGIMYNMAGSSFINLVYIALYSTDCYLEPAKETISEKCKVNIKIYKNYHQERISN